MVGSQLRTPDRVDEAADTDTDTDIFGNDIWLGNAPGAVTMLYHNMARALLLINQPPSLLMDDQVTRTSSSDLLVALRNIESRTRTYATEIISTTNGMQKYGAVRARAL